MHTFRCAVAAALLGACGGRSHGPDPSPASSGIHVSVASAVVTAGADAVPVAAELSNVDDVVSWSLDGPGALSETSGPSTLYVPPSSVAATSLAVVTATAGSVSASAEITVAAAGAPGAPHVEIHASAAEITVGQPGVTLTATTNGDPASVAWWFFGPGTLSADKGASVTYLPPPGMPLSASVTIKASIPGASAYTAIMLHPRPTFPGGTNPGALVSDGRSIWVGASYGITKLRAADGTVEGTFPGQSITAMTYDGRDVWAGNNWPNVLTRIRASDGANLGSFPTGEAGTTRSLLFDGGHVWAAISHAKAVLKIRASNGAIVGRAAVDSAIALAFDGTYLWVLSAPGVLTRVRSIDATPLENVWVGGAPGSVLFDGTSLWVMTSAGPTDATILQVDPIHGFVLRKQSFPVRGAPAAFALDRSSLWMVDGSSWVHRVRLEDLTEEPLLAFGLRPSGLFFDGTFMWVANAGDGTVMRQ